MGGWQPCYQGLSSSRTFSLEGVARRERESLGESLDIWFARHKHFFVDVFNRVTWCGGTIHL